MGFLLRFRENKYSQNGEDGVIRELLVRLGISKGWFVDVGAWDGRHLSNTFSLVERGWEGVEIEPDPDKFVELLRTEACFPGQLLVFREWVSEDGPSSLDSLLRCTNVPIEFEVLNIDIDSYDWHVWRGLHLYHPKVVVIEVNSSYPPGVDVVHTTGNAKPGSSFTAMLRLGQSKGYSLVCHTGNMIFVRRDLVPRLALPQTDLADPNQLFLDLWVAKKGLRGFLSKGVLCVKQFFARHVRWLVLLLKPDFGQFK